MRITIDIMKKNYGQFLKTGTERPAKRLRMQIIPAGFLCATPGGEAHLFFRGIAMTLKTCLMDEAAVRRAIVRISHEILEKNRGPGGLCLVGVQRRGTPIAQMIRDSIRQFDGADIPCGNIDISYYRDDLSPEHESPLWKKAALPFDVEGTTVVIVDDVIFTGRTARAAMEAVISCGRPRKIQLAVLVDRGHRELPIRADYVGKNVPTSRRELIEVNIPPFEKDMRVCLMEM